jgi:hypothetical protein
MIPTSDGSRAKAALARMNPKAAAALREALVAAIAKASELAAEACALSVQKHLAAGVAISANDVIDAVTENTAPIESTALDAAADVLSAHEAQGVDVGTAIAAGTVAAVAGGASLGKVRGEVYHAGSVLGDVEAVASGSPEKIVRRGAQHAFWRAFGKAGRGIFRKIGGKR